MIELGRPLSMKARSAFGSSADWPIDLNIASTPSVRVGHGLSRFLQGGSAISEVSRCTADASR
jgi:hypothetical protein